MSKDKDTETRLIYSGDKSEYRIETFDGAGNRLESIGSTDWKKKLKDWNFPNSGIASLLNRSPLNPISISSPVAITPLNLKAEIQERWETYDTEDFNSLRNTIKQKIRTFNDNPENPSPKVIRKIAEELNVYSVTLKKFVLGEDLSKLVALKFFNKLVSQIDETTLDYGCYINNNVAFMKCIANKKIDTIVIEHSYPENMRLSKYQDRIITGYNLIEEKWLSFWKDYPTKKIDQIIRYGEIEADDKNNIKNFIEDPKVHLYFKVLPHFMQRRLPDRYLQDGDSPQSFEEAENRIGLFYIVCGFDDQWVDEKSGEIFLDKSGNPIEIPGLEEVSHVSSPDLEDVIFKDKS